MPMKFKLLDGKHVDYDVDGVPTIHGPGAIIESDMDLATMFHNKFERLQDTAGYGQQGNQGPTSQGNQGQGLVKSPQRSTSKTELKEIKKNQYRDFLNKMSVDHLRQHAREESVDVGDTKDKKAIIDKLVGEVFDSDANELDSFPSVHSRNPETGQHELVKDHSPEVTDEPSSSAPSTLGKKEMKLDPPAKNPKDVALPADKPHDETKRLQDAKEAHKAQEANKSQDPRDTIKSKDKK
jgi:hypothetical protein